MTSGEALALAQNDCTHCLGLGECTTHGVKLRTCNCVWRAVFRCCLRRFRKAQQHFGFVSRASTAFDTSAPKNKRIKCSTDEEYSADFILIAKRTLMKDTPIAWRVFCWHLLLGADYRLCCRRLGISRGDFYHLVYRVQQALGKAFSEIEPYALFPIDEYFGGTVRAVRPLSTSEACGAILSTDSPRSERTRAALNLRRPLRAPLLAKAA